MSVLNSILCGGGLVIEVTRRCNMSCKHCLRGTAQNVDIDLALIDKFLSKLKGKYFKCIVFTGGEPSLNTEAIAYTLECVKKYNIHIYAFQIITNGKNITDSFVSICNKWIEFLGRGEVDLSVDDYHDNVSVYDMNKLKKVKTFGSWDRGQYDILNVGNAKKNSIGECEDMNIRSMLPNKFFIHDKYLIYASSLVLTCSGNINFSCDFSYEEEDKKKLCSLDDFSYKVLFDEANKSKNLRPYLEYCSSNAREWIEYLESNNLI